MQIRAAVKILATVSQKWKPECNDPIFGKGSSVVQILQKRRLRSTSSLIGTRCFLPLPRAGKLRPVNTPAGRLTNPAAPVERMELINADKAD